MIFLEPVYQWIEKLLDGKVNHLPLIRLIIHSIDSLLVWYGLFLVFWGVSIWWRKKQGISISSKRERIKHLFFIYMMMLYHVTVFRNNHTIWNIQVTEHAISDVNLIPFYNSIKLFFGNSLFSALYNVLGNIIWFMPLGYFLAIVGHKKRLYEAVIVGLLVSASIEILQFLFFTGITDIDDLLFNVVGSWLGYNGYYWIAKAKGVKDETNHG